jgi:hypothetical protein
VRKKAICEEEGWSTRMTNELAGLQGRRRFVKKKVVRQERLTN